MSVNELFDDYIAFYKINLSGNHWIKGILRTPMSLKLFCDLYGNSRVGNLDKNSLVITRLFQKKIDSVEESYRKQEKETKQQSMIKTVLVTVATLLTNKKEVTFEDILNESRVYRSPSNKAYELYGNQICHDTDRSFVVWFDEEECKYIELKEIKPIRPNTYDDYELNIKILYGDAED